jgi:hypothetical protein
LCHRRPDVAGVGDFREKLLGEVGADLRRRRVDDWRLASNGHRLLQRGHLQLLVDCQCLVDDHANAFAFDALESRQLER